MIGKIAHAQRYRIDAQQMGGLVHRRFHRKGSGRMSRRAHGDRLRLIGAHQPMARADVRACIKPTRDSGGGVRIIAVGCGLSQYVMLNGVE